MRQYDKRPTAHFGQVDDEKIPDTAEKLELPTNSIKLKKPDKSLSLKPKREKKNQKEEAINIEMNIQTSKTVEPPQKKEKIKGRHQKVHLAEEVNDTIISLIKDKKGNLSKIFMSEK